MESGDRKLNEVAKVTDMAYVPVIMADGSIGQIAKSDLASVVAGLITYQPSLQLNPADFNEVIGITRKSVSYTVQATANVANSPTGIQSPVRGYLEVTNIADSYVSQRFLDYRLNAAFLRTFSGGIWTAWQRIDNFGYNSLEELSAGVAGQIGTGIVIEVRVEAGESYTLKEQSYAIYAIVNRSQVGYGALFCIGTSSVAVLSDPKGVIGDSKISITKSGTGVDTVVTNNYATACNLRIRKLA